jgi:hypothetical protein
MKKDIQTKWMHFIGSAIIIQRYMSLFLRLIEENSYDWAIQLSQKKGNQVANAQNRYEATALMLATELKPVSKALELIDALMDAGASMDTSKYQYYGPVFLFAFRRGVDPAIFDKLIMWDSIRENLFQDWWSKCDRNRNEVFVLACESQNISLVEHILSLAFTQYHQKFFLESMANHILESLEQHRKSFDEEFMVKWLRLVRKYVDEIPQEYTIKHDNHGNPTDEHINDPSNGKRISLSGYFTFALINSMFDFIEEYAVLFNADYKYKETIWRWLHEKENRCLSDGLSIEKVGRNAIPVKVRKFALSYERNELSKRNKDIALVLLRTLKSKYQSDILELVSSFLYTTPLDIKASDKEKRDPRYCCDCKSWYICFCICMNFPAICREIVEVAGNLGNNILVLVELLVPLKSSGNPGITLNNLGRVIMLILLHHI